MNINTSLNALMHSLSSQLNSHDSLIYVWKNNEINLLEDLIAKEGFPDDCYVVDTRFDTSKPDSRYGMWKSTTDKWESKDLGEFPTEFRTALLLIGIN